MPLFGRKRGFGEREVPEPDWQRVTGRFVEDEQKIAACKGWSIGLEPGAIDHPCAVYLTDRAVYVDIRPDTLASPETVPIPLAAVARCAVGASDQGTPRLVIMYDPVGNFDTADVQGVGVDLRPPEAGRQFGERVCAEVDRYQGNL